MSEKVPDTFFRIAGLALILTLAAVLAAAGIRHGVDEASLRPLHRLTATLEVPVALWLAWRAFRTPLFPAAIVALIITATLSVVGILGGKNPPQGIAAVNLLGGLALAATFAWIAGHARRSSSAPARVLIPLGVLLAVQLALGAWVSIRGPAFVLPLHALLAVALVGLLACLVPSRLLLAAAIAAPITGMTALHYEFLPLASLAHTLAAAMLACAAAYAWARSA